MYGRWVEEPVVLDLGVEWGGCEHPNVVVVDGVERCLWCEPEDTTTPMVGVLACIASALLVLLVVSGLVLLLGGRV